MKFYVLAALLTTATATADGHGDNMEGDMTEPDWMRYWNKYKNDIGLLTKGSFTEGVHESMVESGKDTMGWDDPANPPEEA